MDVAYRLTEGVALTDAGCWEWTGARQRSGYGALRVDGATRTTHRLAWEVWRGPIPAGHYVCHTCDNPPCFNPDHLFPGTARDNNRDMKRKGRHGNTKVTDAQVREIRSVFRPGAAFPDPASAAALRDRYGISLTTVYDILKGAVRNDLI